jgi:aryl-alcohol dehydrogenase-like predicted oxidoreductase
VRNFLAYSLRRLGTDHVDVYRLGRSDYGVLSRGLLSGHWSTGRTLAPGDFRLTVDDLAAIDCVVPADAAAGDRYDARQMAMLDSERGRPGAR